MANGLDIATADGRTIADVIFRPLGDVPLVVVDVGARNGMFMLPASYARRAELIGFEPNADEQAKLSQRKTEAITIGMDMPRFRSEIFHDCALWDREEERPFYITAGVGASTMMGEANPAITRRMFRGGLVDDGGLSMYDRHFAVKAIDTVRCRPLDALIPAGGIVDFLKIDVEGGEMRVLRGAESLLSERRALFIMTEFSFATYYDEHPLLGDQQVYLGDRGYRLLDIQYSGRSYSRDRSRIPPSNDHRPIYGGDAWFMLDPDRNKLDTAIAQRLAAILLTFGFHSLAMSLLREAGLNNESELTMIETALSHVPLRRRLRDAWLELPRIAQRNLAGASTFLRRFQRSVGG